MTGHVRFTSLDIAAFGSWIIVDCIDAVSQAMGGVLGIVLVILGILDEDAVRCKTIMEAHDC